MENFYPKSEIDGIKEAIDNSPVDIKAEVIKNDVSILDRFNDYGAIVISQTHGRGDGAFYLCSRSWVNKLGDNDKFHFYRNYVISLLQRKVVDMVFPWFYYTVTPQYFTGKSFDYPFIYGNYCWSRGLGITGIYNSCFVGYDVASNFLINDDMSISYFTSLFNGQTHQKSVDNIGGYAFQNNWVEPATNHNKPDKRYFSIAMNDVEDKGNGKFVVSGKINGFKNLKKDIDFRLYYETYGIDPDLESVKFINLHVDTEGNFREEFLVSDHINGTGGELKFQIAFKYNTNYYYGEIKSSGTKKGTKWLKLIMSDSKRTINIEDLGLLNADIIRIQGVRYIDENNYLSTSDDGYVFIEYRGRMDHLYAAKGIKSFITNDTINVIGPAALNRSELEVFECAAAYELSIDAFSRTSLRNINLLVLGYIGSHAIRFNYKLESINLKGDYGFCRSSVVNNGENVKEIKLWGRFTEYEEGPEKAFYDAFADLMSKRSEVDLKSPCPYCKVKHEYSTKIYINKIYIERALKYAESGNDILRTLEKFKKNCLGNKHELNCPNYKRLLFPLEED